MPDAQSVSNNRSPSDSSRVVGIYPIASGEGTYSESTHSIVSDEVNRIHPPASEVDRKLRKALAELQHAEKNVVFWFAEMVRRKLHRELGYSSIHQYASEALGFSKNKTYCFLRLVSDFERLPQLRESVAKGEIGWTKAREIAKVASEATEGR